jgi:magnesium-transporting ATPase (P-type)
MYDDKINEPAKANKSDINEDLGEIEYLFSDKTGTLTENEMIFKQFAIDGKIYEERQGRLVLAANNQLVSLNVIYFNILVFISILKLTIFKDDKLMRFLEILSVCHSVHP